MKINSGMDAAKFMRGLMPLRCDVHDVNSVVEKAGFENKDPVYNDGRVIVKKGHLSWKAERLCCTRKNLAPHGLEEVELQQA